MVICTPRWRCTDLSGPTQEGVCLDFGQVDVLLSPGQARRIAKALAREADRAYVRMNAKGSRPFRSFTYPEAPTPTS